MVRRIKPPYKALTLVNRTKGRYAVLPGYDESIRIAKHTVYTCEPLDGVTIMLWARVDQCDLRLLCLSLVENW